MALSWRTTRALPYLPDYAAASRREQETKPIRGDETAIKPLGRRDQKWRSIAHWPDGTIAIGYGVTAEGPTKGSPSITYHADGIIKLHTPRYGYNKATEQDVIHEVLGWETVSRHRVLWVNTAQGYKSLDMWEGAATAFTQPEGTIRKPTMLTPEPLCVHVVNRKGANAVRERYKAFINYALGVHALYQYCIPKELLEEVGIETNRQWNYHNGSSYYVVSLSPYSSGYSHNHAHAHASRMQSNDPGEMLRAALMLGSGLTDAAGVKRAIDRVLFRVHYSECLTKREVTTGKIAAEAYKWAVPTPE